MLHDKLPADTEAPKQADRMAKKMPHFEPLGKRVTRKPAKFLSPFKKGTWTRTLPNMETALAMRDFICADDSVLKK